MANLKRNKVVALDYPMSKFLYYVLKQADIKSIDWNQVATDCEISNGHAARMRWSRFKAQMEGSSPVSRRGRPEAEEKKQAGGKMKVKKRRAPKTPKVEEDASDDSIKSEHSDSNSGNVSDEPLLARTPCRVKPEKHHRDALGERLIKTEPPRPIVIDDNSDADQLDQCKAEVEAQFKREMLPWPKNEDAAIYKNENEA